MKNIIFKMSIRFRENNGNKVNSVKTEFWKDDNMYGWQGKCFGKEYGMYFVSTDEGGVWDVCKLSAETFYKTIFEEHEKTI
jgi:hypothetical protein